jgi:diaminopimelate decarboxylase
MSLATSAPVDACEPPRLLADFGSPLYVYDLDRVAASLEALRRAFDDPAVDLHYAIVCNKNRALVRRLHEWGVGVHANTPGDAAAALAAGVPAARIVYSGTNLDARDLEFLHARGIHMNLDCVDQVLDRARLGPGAIGLRYLIDDPERRNRIGVGDEELDEALAAAAAAELRVTGLHMHAGTNNMRAERALRCFERMQSASRRLPDLEYLDVGGGFGIPYRDGGEPFDMGAFAEGVLADLGALSKQRSRRIRLLVEPGRVLVAAAGTLYVTVVSVKQRGGRRYVGVDSTVGNVVVESVYHAFHRIEAVGVDAPPLDVPTDVCGNTTHSRDFLGRGLSLPPLAPGDVLAVRDVGAYGYAMSSHFLNRPRPAELVVEGGRPRLTTRRETFDDLLAAQLSEA